MLTEYGKMISEFLVISYRIFSDNDATSDHTEPVENAPSLISLQSMLLIHKE